MAINVSHQLVQQAAESLGKIRAILRYLNGSIEDKSLKSSNMLTTTAESYLNRFLLSQLYSFEKEVRKPPNFIQIITNISIPPRTIFNSF